MDPGARLRRIRIEAQKLAAAHPDVTYADGVFSCDFRPPAGPARRIVARVPVDYPYAIPKAYVMPYRDIAGIDGHIYEDGQVCLVHEWDPALHTLSFVFTQAKKIILEAVARRYGRWRSASRVPRISPY